MQPPIAGQVVLGWDPAFRTGCKLAVVDPTGKVLDTTVIYPTAPQNKVAEAKSGIKEIDCQISHYPDFPWKRNGIAGIRTDHCGPVKGTSGKSTVHYCQ